MPCCSGCLRHEFFPPSCSFPHAVRGYSALSCQRRALLGCLGGAVHHATTRDAGQDLYHQVHRIHRMAHGRAGTDTIHQRPGDWQRATQVQPVGSSKQMCGWVRRRLETVRHVRNTAIRITLGYLQQPCVTRHLVSLIAPPIRRISTNDTDKFPSDISVRLVRRMQFVKPQERVQRILRLGTARRWHRVTELIEPSGIGRRVQVRRRILIDVRQ